MSPASERWMAVDPPGARRSGDRLLECCSKPRVGFGEVLDHEAAGAGAGGGEFVVGVGEGARAQGQAAAADASGQVVAQADELGDAGVEFVAPLGGDRGPVVAGGGAVLGEPFEGLADAGQG